MNRITIGGIALLLVLLVLGSGSLFTVAQTEQVLLVQFGEIVRPIETPGLHARSAAIPERHHLRPPAAERRTAG